MEDIPELTSTIPSSDIINEGITFMKTYWDDIAIMVIISSIVFLYILVSGIQIKGISDNPESIAEGVRKIVFRGRNRL